MPLLTGAYSYDFHPGSEGAEGEEQFMHSALSRNQFAQGPVVSQDRAHKLKHDALAVANSANDVSRRIRTTTHA